MDFKDLNSKAWKIRKIAAKTFNCPVMEITWKDCLIMASKIETKGKNEMEVTKLYHICRTGKLKQHFTLYITVNIASENFFNQSCYFVQNLGFDETSAINKVNALIALEPDNIKCDIDFSDSKKREYCDLKAFGFNWKKTEKGFITDLVKYSTIHDKSGQAEKLNNTLDMFWTTWRENKQEMKDNGFSIFKSDNGEFKLFFKNCSNEEMIKKMSILDKKHEVSGQYVGNIGDKVKELSVEVEKVYMGAGNFGPFQSVIFKTDNGDTLKTKYSGSKHTFNEGEKILISGTVKNNQVCNLMKTTILTRVGVKSI